MREFMSPHSVSAGFALGALVSYKNLENMLNQSFEEVASPEKNGVKPSSYQLRSKVVSALVSNPDTQHLHQPVILTIRHLEVGTDHLFKCMYLFTNASVSKTIRGK